jgi:hypothetical protein
MQCLYAAGNREEEGALKMLAYQALKLAGQAAMDIRKQQTQARIFARDFGFGKFGQVRIHTQDLRTHLRRSNGT